MSDERADALAPAPDQPHAAEELDLGEICVPPRSPRRLSASLSPRRMSRELHQVREESEFEDVDLSAPMDNPHTRTPSRATPSGSPLWSPSAPGSPLRTSWLPNGEKSPPPRLSSLPPAHASLPPASELMSMRLSPGLPALSPVAEEVSASRFATSPESPASTPSMGARSPQGSPHAFIRRVSSGGETAILPSPLIGNKSPLRLPLSTEHMETPSQVIFNDSDSRMSSPRGIPRVMPMAVDQYESDLDTSSVDFGALGMGEELASEDFEMSSTSNDFGADGMTLRAQIETMKREMLSSSPHGSAAPSVFSVANVAYPAPIPVTLLKPPLLSRQPAPVSAPSHTLHIELPPKPKWGPSPLEPQFEGEAESDEEEFSSDGATVLSDDLDRGAEETESIAEPVVEKRRSWLGGLFHRKQGAGYEDVENPEDEFRRVTSEEADEQMLQFSKLDEHGIQQQAEILGLGARRAAGNPTEVPSLIEEIEIRKKAKRIQREVIARDVGRIDMVRDLNVSRHPMAESVVPTLLQMQQVASAEYKMRKSWMNEALRGGELPKPDFEQRSRQPSASSTQPVDPNGGETLAQRRARLKRTKETLSERRERLKRERAQPAVAAG